MPKHRHAFAKRTASLAAVLIVRDEARCIARCLQSVRPWVDRLVVVDTGSTDDTAALAASHGAEIHHLAWPNHFAEARNHALALADADWNLILDADEWIADGGDSLRRWCAGSRRLGIARVESSFDAQDGSGTSTSLSWITRLLPRGVRYRGRIHEQPVSALPRARMPLIIGHDGYRDEQTTAKRGRNRPLLLLDLAEHPGDPYILYQLGRDAEADRDHAAASEYYARALPLAPSNAGWLHDLVVRHLHCLGQSGQGEEALVLAERLMDQWITSPDFFFVLGNLLLDRAMADPAQAREQWLPYAAQAWERCLEIGERPDLEGSVTGRGSQLAAHNLTILRSQMALLAA